MCWEQIYKQRLTTADKAILNIKSGDRVVLGHAAGEPLHLVDAMVNNKAQLFDVEIVHMVPMGNTAYLAEGMENHFHHNSLFAGMKTRKAIMTGYADYTPSFFSEIPKLFAGPLRIDVALIQVSPPDEHGYCSLGVSVDYTKSAAENAKIVIAQINKNMPRCLGDCFIHISAIDFLVRHDAEIIQHPSPNVTTDELVIGNYCAQLINDGDTLQLGIGAIPDAILLSLKNKKNLGIHSEMLSDGILDLVESGVINNKCKSLNAGKSVVSFLMGTTRLYNYVNNNPAVALHPVDYVNNPIIIAQNDNMVSINSCVQIDLLGQVVSETIGPMQISGVGGQVDFIRGAGLSKGGRSILAMCSTTNNKKISKIVPILDKGAVVTTTRNDVEYIVTEYGIAHLKGQTNKQRARSLISISHPLYKNQLAINFKQMFNEDY